MLRLVVVMAGQTVKSCQVLNGAVRSGENTTLARFAGAYFTVKYCFIAAVALFVHDNAGQLVRLELKDRMFVVGFGTANPSDSADAPN